jgi:hypothetical protein
MHLTGFYRSHNAPGKLAAMHEPHEICADCSTKLEPVEVSGMSKAILVCPLDEDCTTPRIDNCSSRPTAACSLAWTGARALGSQEDLIRNIHGVAKVADLDGEVAILSLVQEVAAND